MGSNDGRYDGPVWCIEVDDTVGTDPVLWYPPGARNMTPTPLWSTK